jgi:NFU1 iron-sulfur cluster scaffold homolog, mitochondrial
MEKINAVLESHLTFQVSYDEHKEGKSDPLLEEFKKEEFHNYEVAEQNRIIEAVLDKAIRPALANDGGGIQVIAIEGNTIKIHYQGACGSCPSSTSGTLQYIENFLRDNVHSELVVEAG